MVVALTYILKGLLWLLCWQLGIIGDDGQEAVSRNAGKGG